MMVKELVTITGTDINGKEIIETVDANQTLQEMLKEMFGRDIPIRLIIMQREDGDNDENR